MPPSTVGWSVRTVLVVRNTCRCCLRQALVEIRNRASYTRPGPDLLRRDGWGFLARCHCLPKPRSLGAYLWTRPLHSTFLGGDGLDGNLASRPVFVCALSALPFPPTSVRKVRSSRDGLTALLTCLSQKGRGGTSRHGRVFKTTLDSLGRLLPTSSPRSIHRYGIPSPGPAEEPITSPPAHR